jgi:hypothetical protein
LAISSTFLRLARDATLFTERGIIYIFDPWRLSIAKRLMPEIGVEHKTILTLRSGFVPTVPSVLILNKATSV